MVAHAELQPRLGYYDRNINTLMNTNVLCPLVMK